MQSRIHWIESDKSSNNWSYNWKKVIIIVMKSEMDQFFWNNIFFLLQMTHLLWDWESSDYYFHSTKHVIPNVKQLGFRNTSCAQLRQEGNVKWIKLVERNVKSSSLLPFTVHTTRPPYSFLPHPKSKSAAVIM